MFSFQDKKVLITAGTQGLGKACVESFINAGATVATCARTENDLKLLKEEFGSSLHIYTVDLLDMKECQEFVSSAIKDMNGLNHVVFNPAHSVKVPIQDMSLDDWQQSFDAIFRSMIQIVGSTLPALQKNNDATVVVISSLAAIEPIDIMPASSALRGGIAAWLKLMSQQHSPKGTRFNAVQPGFCDTPAVRKGMQKRAEAAQISVEDAIAKFCENVPLRRLGDPKDIANAVMYLSSECSRFITGTNLLADGGYSHGV